MTARMPVLRQDDMLEILHEFVDQRHDLVAARHRQRAAGAEVVLQVDDNKRLVGHDSLSSVSIADAAKIDRNRRLRQRLSRDHSRPADMRGRPL